MPLTIEMPSAVRFLVPGAVAGIVAFAFSRVMIEPLIGAAVDYEGAREHAESLLAGGVRIFEYQPTMIHSKTIVVDGIWSTIGSMNFDNRSLAFNNESNLVVWDRPFGSMMDSTFADDLRYTREIQLQEFKRRPMTDRLVELGASIFSRLL